MLQNAQKAITSAFSGSFIKKLSQYLHDCVREEVKSSTFRNLKGDKDNKWCFLEGTEQVFTLFDAPLLLDGTNSLLTEVMIQGDVSQKEKYLIYGFLFLTGKNGRAKKNNEFLTPLLYAPCKLERAGTKISCSLSEEMLSLNTGALAQLMKKDDEEDVDQMLSGLLDVVPELPLTNESLEIFLTTLKSLVPELEIEMHPDFAALNASQNNAEEFYTEAVDGEIDFDSLEEISKAPKVKLDKIAIEFSQAVILTKRPTITAGVLHELTQIGEKPIGTMRENALNIINEEYLASKGKISQKIKENKDFKDFFPITPLSLSDGQEEVIRKIEEHDFLAVYGPPGTGKSQTIVNLVAHLIARGKTVLVASRMDKAIDVVAERLNELNAPYLALRAGRANYQKQLAFQLEDLLSNKVDLDSDFEDANMARTQDMEQLLGEIARMEQAVEKIIKLEEQYSEIEKEKIEQDGAIGEKRFVTRDLKLEEIEQIRKLLENIELNHTKSGFIASIALTLDYGKIRKILKLRTIDKDEMLSRLSYELDSEELNAKLLKVENQIYKIGNLQQMLKKIESLKGKQKHLAVDILKNKRRSALKDLLCDQKKRQRLIVHKHSLVSRRQNQQSKILEKEDFKPLLAAFPCWCTTTYAISNSIPLKSGMFDVVIIDEASQCDIASCFPILYRAKKAVIVGDDKQLPHLSFLEKAKEQSFLNQYGIDDKYQLMWRFRTNSMFDLANYYSTSPVLLDEHFRSKKPIIEFSSQQFYGGRIKIMKPYLHTDSTVEIIPVPEGKVDFDVTRNKAESEAVIKKLQDIIASNPTASIGIISPFRGQVELIKSDVIRMFEQETILKHQIEVGTAHTFQGDERDIMLISWAIAPNSHTQSLTFLQKPNLFNVAITRARHKVINFISRDINEFPSGLMRDYLEYIRVIERREQMDCHTSTFKNEFEEEVFKNLDVPAFAGVEVGGVNADVVIGKLVIELDGAPDAQRARVSPMKKQAILERCGFKVIRITKREWGLSKEVCLDRIKEWL